MYLILKKMIDIITGIIGIIILIPLSIIIKIIFILNKDYDTIFYTQNRIGKKGKEFKMYKYRTMVINSDELLKEILKDKKIKKEYEASYKIKNDPRLTKIGKILRKTSIDEMPQFINILKGDMTLVGPRPVIKEEIKKFGKSKDMILSVKPGLTGNWAINGKNNLTYDERIKYELYYINNKSITLDLKIILKTITVIIKGEN